MKIQYLAVIFIVIILPISMVLSYHIQTQIKTINLQTDYNTKLYNATYDAIRAFQINTVNNRYSTVSDSKMRDIDAAVNTFYNSIATNETLSREDMKQSYIPALVFTLYDGYYIHNKYDNVYSAKDQGKVNIDNATTTYGTKPYIYYSCRYKKGTRDFVVNYTLDNAITIYGNLGSGYETISGYLIDYQDITADNYDSNNLKNWKIEYSGVTITPEILTEHIAYLDADREVNEDDFEYLVYHGKKVYYHTTNNKFFWYDNYSITDINDATTNSYASARLWDGHLHSTSSLEYLHSAKKFSEYVTQKIGDITQKNAVTKDGTPITSGVKDDGTQIGFTVDTGKKPIFNPTLDNNDPLISGSIFNENRIAVIRYSITSNLVAAIANYTMYSGNNYAYSLPVLSELDWEKITHEICMISFMQGIPIGHKYYNDYCVVTNNSNEEVINQNNIYIITNNTSTGEREYHLPGCTYLMETADLKIQNAAYSNLSFIRQTLRIAEGDYHYFYPQMRGTYTKTTKTKIYITGCYHCIVNADETYATDQIIKGEIIGKNNKWKDQVIYDASTNTRLQTIREAYMKALFRERYDLYQANMDAMNVVLEEENTRSQNNNSSNDDGGGNTVPGENSNPTHDNVVNDIRIIPSTLDLWIGETSNVYARVEITGSFTKNIIWSTNNPNIVTWSSSNSNIVTVDSYGVVTAKAVGTVTITATTQDGTKQTIRCNVTETPPTSVTLNKTSLSLPVNGTDTLFATVTNDSDVTWSTSDSGIATVDSNGLVTAKKEGTATITATANDGSGASATCTVNVEKQKVTSISLSLEILQKKNKGTTKVGATINPSNAGNKTLTWSSSDTTIASVNNKGEVTFHKTGKVSITAKATDGSNVSQTINIQATTQVVSCGDTQWNFSVY